MDLAVTFLHRFNSALWYNKGYIQIILSKPFMNFNTVFRSPQVVLLQWNSRFQQLLTDPLSLELSLHPTTPFIFSSQSPPFLIQFMSRLVMQSNGMIHCQRSYSTVHTLYYWFSNADSLNDTTMWRNCHHSKVTWEKWLNSFNLKDCTFFGYYILPRSYLTLISFFF